MFTDYHPYVYRTSKMGNSYKQHREDFEAEVLAEMKAKDNVNKRKSKMFETKNNEMVYRTKQEILDAANYKGKPGARVKIKEPNHCRNFRLPDRIWDRLPEPKSESVRNALDFCIINGVF